MNRVFLLSIILCVKLNASAQDEDYYVDFLDWPTFANQVYQAYRAEHLTYCSEELVDFEDLEDFVSYYAAPDNKSFRIEKALYYRIENRIQKMVKNLILQIDGKKSMSFDNSSLINTVVLFQN